VILEDYFLTQPRDNSQKYYHEAIEQVMSLQLANKPTVINSKIFTANLDNFHVENSYHVTLER